MRSTVSENVWKPTTRTSSPILEESPYSPSRVRIHLAPAGGQVWLMRGSHSLAVPRTVPMLLRDAEIQLARLCDASALELTPAMWHTFERSMQELVVDGGPLPQLGPSATGCLSGSIVVPHTPATHRPLTLG